VVFLVVFLVVWNPDLHASLAPKTMD